MCCYYAKRVKFWYINNSFLFIKRIRASFNTVEQKRLLMDLDVSMRLAQYPYTVQFYGALFKEVYFVLFICYLYYWYIVLVFMLFSRI